MIRYELLSNVAASEQGLGEFPVLADLADSLAMRDIETRFVKQVAREEGEINVASAQFAKGVTVRERSVKTLRPETTLKGCMSWARAVTARIDRGLHMDIEKLRATNGAGLILPQLYARDQKAFFTGLENGSWDRLRIPPDLSLQTVPKAIETTPELKEEFLARRTRPASFFGLLGQAAELDFLPSDFLKKAAAMVKGRDPKTLDQLSEAEVINVGLIGDIQERYDKLVEEFFAILAAGELGGELAPIFGFLTQGISYEALREALLPFTLENKRERIEDKRSLVNELRIGIGLADSAHTAQFHARFSSLVVQERVRQDPELFTHAIRLGAADAEETDVLSAVRPLYRAILNGLEEQRGNDAGEETPLAAPLKQQVFELVVTLTYMGEYTQAHRDKLVPKRANMARQILSCFSFNVFNIQQLRSLNSKLPARGVATNLANKVPLTVGELATMAETLNSALFPLADVAERLSSSILARYKDQEAQLAEEARAAYLQGSYPLLRNTNYLLGLSGQNAIMRGAALAGSQAMGLTVLSSTDQIRNREVLEKLRADPDLQIEGYVPLLTSEEAKLLPIDVNLEFLARAYRYLYSERVVGIVRRFTIKKIRFLQETYGERLFEAIYRHVTWEHRLILSRYQLGLILYKQKVFDPHRLRESGFRAGGMDNGHENDNPWLHLQDDSGAPAKDGYGFVPGRIEKEYKTAYQSFNGLVTKCKELARADKDAKSLPGVVLAQAAADNYDLHNEEFQEALAASTPSGALWEEIQEIAGANFQALVGTTAEGEAVEFTLPGPLAFCALLKPSHPFKVEGKDVLVRLKPAVDEKASDVDARSQLFAKLLQERLTGSAGKGRMVKNALELLQVYWKFWGGLRRMAEIALLAQALKATILTLVEKAPPEPGDLAALPDGTVMCLGISSSDLGRFHKLVPQADLNDGLATLSQLASWLARFPRLRAEMDDVREIVADVTAIVSDFNIPVFSAPYMVRYKAKLKELDAALDFRPEDISIQDLEQIEKVARETEKMTYEIFQNEARVPPKDRWLNRITIRLKRLRPNVDLTFVRRLYEHASAPQTDTEREEGEAGAGEPVQHQEEYQTFSERVRNVIDYRERLNAKEVFVLSPGPNQRRLTINLADELFRLKGIFLPVLADITACENYLDELRTRLPPHRVFYLNRS